MGRRCSAGASHCLPMMEIFARCALQAQNKELQNLRLEVDSRHRTVNELGAKVRGTSVS